ncbi:lipopolysaccharide assembly protein LapA domain-containing protein [Psittacicella hinzii]|uniref:Lipopolysaccharide assembly protein A domain-containing protein n=1 Tax=Psittacicella hinzii TaxID=2028575 RepID=A0A3A1YX37_9GAMM|nr:LapA family protein [Psittacicella hinzii]RIY40617.1 hypothetical protein CKF58_00425 [Psittacicella hinzii]
MKVIKYLCYVLFLCVLAVVTLLFTSANDTQVTVNYFAGEFTGALSFILGVAFIFGFICALIVLLLLWLVNKSKTGLLRMKVSRLEAENKKLRVALEVKSLDSNKQRKTTQVTHVPENKSMTQYPVK